MRHRRVATLVAIAVAVSVAGCGGSSNSATTTSTTTGTSIPAARSAFIAAATPICQEMKRRGEQASEGAASATDVDTVTRTFVAMADVVDQGVAELRALTPPPGEEAQVTQLLDHLAQTASGARALAAVPQDDTEAQSAAAAKVVADQSAADDALKAYGLGVCAFSG